MPDNEKQKQQEETAQPKNETVEPESRDLADEDLEKVAGGSPDMTHISGPGKFQGGD